MKRKTVLRNSRIIAVILLATTMLMPAAGAAANIAAGISGSTG